MRPPICAICRQKFDPFTGDAGVVSFVHDPEDAAWYTRAKKPGFVGHPPHQEWFCAEHAPLANAHSTLTKRAALADVRAIFTALARGPLAPGAVRVLVLSEATASHRDFPDLDAARAYADDAAAEVDPEPPVAIVTDGARVLARGRSFTSR